MKSKKLFLKKILNIGTRALCSTLALQGNGEEKYVVVS
jgi:hypothetical protein